MNWRHHLTCKGLGAKLHTDLAEAEKALLWQAPKTIREASIVEAIYTGGQLRLRSKE